MPECGWYCSHCATLFPENIVATKSATGLLLCDKCNEVCTDQCDNCGDPAEPEDLYEATDGRLVCEPCLIEEEEENE